MHVALVKVADQVAWYTRELDRPHIPSLRPPCVGMSQASWVPDIYHFPSAMLSPEEKFASKPPMPFTPSLPRINENESLNVDSGALFVDAVEENSFMAWF